MRISDWSSDVCSSDLTKAPPGLLRAARRSDADKQRQPQNEADERADAAGNDSACSEKQEARGHHESEAAEGRRTPLRDPIPDRPALASLREIGRAACREKVCQYV